MTWMDQIQLPELSALIEVLVISMIFYFLILFFKGTRGASVLTGFVLVLVTLILLTRIFRLDSLNWILQRFSGFLAISVVIIFQQEIRRALAELGKQHVFISQREERSVVDHIVQAVRHLAEKKVGALIAIEREIGLRSIQESGTSMDSQVSPELLATIFYPNTPLHDGGVIIRENRIVAAGCFFPLSQRDELSKSLGTRHRAAIGITEETDAIVVIVSEETGGISVAFNGRLSRGLDEDRLERTLATVLLRRKSSREAVARIKEQLDLTPEAIARTEQESSEEGEDRD